MSFGTVYLMENSSWNSLKIFLSILTQDARSANKRSTKLITMKAKLLPIDWIIDWIFCQNVDCSHSDRHQSIKNGVIKFEQST